MKSSLHRLFAVAAVLALSACASPVSRDEIRRSSAETNAEINAARQAQQQRIDAGEQLVVRTQTPFLTSRTVAIAREASLPAVFARSSAFVRPPSSGRFSIPQVAALITKNLGIRVRVRPDVFLPATMLVPGGGAQTNTNLSAPTAGAAAMNGQAPVQANLQVPPIMGAPPGGDGFAPAAPSIADTLPTGYDTGIDFDFTGSLADYLGRLSSQTGINWKWQEPDNELVLYRLVRRTFTLDAAPSKLTISSTVAKGSGGNAASSAAGADGAISTTSGGASGDTKASLDLSSDAWTAVLATLNNMRTKAGSVEGDPATRTITMIDTRDVVEDAGRFIEHQNEILGRQVLMNVRLLTVALNRKNQFDVNLNAMLQRYSGDQLKWRFQSASVGALSGRTAEALTYSVLSPDATASGSSLIVNVLQEIGDIVSDYSRDVVSRNNRSVPISDYSSFGYLAQTTPATSTGNSSGAGGAPGLVPGSVTSGSTLILTPSILSGERLSLLLSLDRSTDPTFDAISTGSGETLQQIQLPRQSGTKIDVEVGLCNNCTLVAMTQMDSHLSNTARNGLLSVGDAASASRQVQVLLITPRVINDH